MASRAISGFSGDLDGAWGPRRSKRIPKPKIYKDHVTFDSPRHGSRGKDSGTSSVPRGNRHGFSYDQRRAPPPSRSGNRGHSSSSESDDEYDYVSEYDQESFEILDDRVKELSRFARTSLEEHDYLIKLIFSALPEETIQGCQTFPNF